ncbi:sigma-70 family RNA polymerase sigma factor [Pseudomonas entomophila]|uniref:sigma-70 family RNA polymerase sigma factor n=1 Tax=Pseudomonas entomophila TaxID=312306 RepID=UPI0023D839B3|nr:sigma-70 family RNA polymerase sigma factor [Pseudomonas entomophila]MDF0729285.1 sigma-70 family RNA polymerase sigma factor [Pseudomonas entomophila]
MDFRPSPTQQLLGQLFAQNYAWLCARLRSRLHCPHSAEDIAAEAFVRILGLPQPETIREPRALLTTIAQRLLQESWRRRDLERAYVRWMSELPAPSQPSPEELHLVVDSLLHLDRVLDRLPGQGKAAFIHSQLGGLTYAAIAERLGISVSRVQQYMTEAFRLCYLALDA